MMGSADPLKDNSWAFLFPQDSNQHEDKIFNTPNAGLDENLGFGNCHGNSSLGALMND